MFLLKTAHLQHAREEGEFKLNALPFAKVTEMIDGLLKVDVETNSNGRI